MALSGTAVVTGGGRGIGQAICTELAARGADVVVADLDESEMNETKALVSEQGRTALTIRTDVTSIDDVETTVETALGEFSSVEILVNNAGIAGPTDPCEATEPEDWDATMAVNLRGPFFTCRALLPHMKERSYGRIVNVSSVTGKRPLPNRTPYAASKMGLIGFTRTLAHEVGRHDINVNAVCPGSVDGPRIRRVIDKQAEETGRSYDEVRTQKENASARGELVEREDVARVVAFLCSADANQMTGQDLNVSAGKVVY